jgi:N-acetyl-gamma-glutamyl-phosphate reductase
MGLSAGIAGASGYAGGELLRLLAEHPDLEITRLFAHRAAGSTVADVHPNLVSLHEKTIGAFSPEAAEGLDVLFLCLPAGQAAGIAAAVSDATCVVDFSGDHRLPPGQYREWYGKEAASIDGWVYGLTELVRAELPGARRISNPGCYPTAAVLALAPLVASGLISGSDIVVDAMSGISGAGAQESLAYSFTELAEDASAYGIGTHRHTPEIERALSLAGGDGATVTFTPHLAPMARGIVATCSAPITAGGADPAEAAREFYVGAPFVTVVDEPPHSKSARGSNTCFVHYRRVERSGRVVAVGVIDNMVKGAAGQAIQNANLALGLPETAGLTTNGIWL